MSSYIVEKQCIDTILSSIWHEGEYRNVIERIFDRQLNLTKRLEKLGADLWEMNIQAVSQCYPSMSREDLPGIGYTKLGSYRFEEVYTDKITTFKALESFLYQCSEGNIPGTGLYKSVNTYKNHITADIIHDMPEYDNAKWF